jgi:hypothetical protein
MIAKHRPVLLVELEYRHGAQVAEIFAWFEARGFAARALTDGHTLAPIDPVQLEALQDETRLGRRLTGSRHSGYVNNIFFLPKRSATRNSRTSALPDVYFNGRQLMATIFWVFPALPSQPSRLAWP